MATMPIIYHYHRLIPMESKNRIWIWTVMNILFMVIILFLFFQQTLKLLKKKLNKIDILDINEILIHEIAKRPQIYDSSLCTKNKAQIRRELWNEIYEALNHLIPFDKLPKIWKNIRDRYQKIKKDLERDGRNIKPKYRYFDMLRFLDEIDCNTSTMTVNQEK